MRLQKPFETVTATVDGDVLAALARADAAFSVADIARLIPERSYPGVRNALHRLVEQGVVVVDGIGRTRLYRLNDEHLAAEPIRQLTSIRSQLFDRITKHAQEWDPPPSFLAIFGSAARGTMRADSDIDILAVRPAEAVDESWEASIADLSMAARRWTGNDVRIIEYNDAEVHGATDSAPLLHSVHEEGMFLIGTASTFRRKVAGQ